MWEHIQLTELEFSHDTPSNQAMEMNFSCIFMTFVTFCFFMVKRLCPFMIRPKNLHPTRLYRGLRNACCKPISFRTTLWLQPGLLAGFSALDFNLGLHALSCLCPRLLHTIFRWVPVWLRLLTNHPDTLRFQASGVACIAESAQLVCMCSRLINRMIVYRMGVHSSPCMPRPFL